MLFYGAVVTPTSLTLYAALPHALLCVSSKTGKIEWIEDHVPPYELQNTLAKHGLVDAQNITELKSGEFLMPGFIDTHTVSHIHDGVKVSILNPRVKL